ncbi:MAG: JAB domain-containing protein [Candidatus Dormibacteria bacterium]
MGTVGNSIQGKGYRAVVLAEREVTLSLAETPDCIGRGEMIGSPRGAAAVAVAVIGTRAAESVLVLMLDARHRVTGYAEVARGTINAARIAPRDVFAPALLANAAAVIVAHNHPSGETSPSTGDRNVTRALVAAGQLLGVPMLDHVIVTARGAFYSFADEGAIGEGSLAVADGDTPAYAPDLAADLAECEAQLAGAQESLAALATLHDVRTARVDAFGGETIGSTSKGYSPAHVFGLDPNSESDVETARERIGELRSQHAAAVRDVKALRAERRAIVAAIARETGKAPRGWFRVAGTADYEPLATFRAAVPEPIAEPVAAVAYVPEWPPIEAYADVDAAPVARPVAPVAAVVRPFVPVVESAPVAAVTVAPFVLAPRKPGGRRAWRLAVTVARAYWVAVAAVVDWMETDRNAEPVGAVFTFRGLAMADGDAPRYACGADEVDAIFARLGGAAVPEPMDDSPRYRSPNLAALLAEGKRRDRAARVDRDAPEPGKQYRLTGGPGEAAISNGSTWAESEVTAEPVAAPVPVVWETSEEHGGLQGALSIGTTQGALFDGDAREYGLAGGMREATRARRTAAAVDALADLDPSVWFDQATQFSCSEADTLAEVFRAAGHQGLAEQFIGEHARGDEEGDSPDHLAALFAAGRGELGDGDAPAYAPAFVRRCTACGARLDYCAHTDGDLACRIFPCAGTANGDHVAPVCRWFLRCGRPATGMTPHPILGDVPTCDRCAAFASEDLPRTEVCDGDAPTYYSIGRPNCQDCAADGRPSGANVCQDGDGVYRCRRCSESAFHRRQSPTVRTLMAGGMVVGGKWNDGDAADIGDVSDGDAPDYRAREAAILDAFYRGVGYEAFTVAERAVAARSAAWDALRDVTDCHAATLLLAAIREGVAEEIVTACGLADGDRPRYGKRGRQDDDAPKVDQVAEAIARLDAGIAELATSEGWARWLKTQSRFHRYSWGNVFLIAAQTGGAATRVAGFHTWKALGRSVRKGEKAIWILAPLARKITEKDESTGEESTRRVVTGFRGCGVFDVAQTDGEPLAEPCSLLTGDGPDGLFEALRGVAWSLGYELEIAYLDAAEAMGSRNGSTDIEAHVIRLNGRREPAQMVKTLAHELGHVLLHGKDGYNGTCRDVAELEAESVAYCVLQRAGIDASAYSFGYVLHWQGGDDKARATLRQSADRIAKAARAIIDSAFPETAEPAGEACGGGRRRARLWARVPRDRHGVAGHSARPQHPRRRQRRDTRRGEARARGPLRADVALQRMGRGRTPPMEQEGTKAEAVAAVVRASCPGRSSRRSANWTRPRN